MNISKNKIEVNIYREILTFSKNKIELNNCTEISKDKLILTVVEKYEHF
jgi:hypothetical protein